MFKLTEIYDLTEICPQLLGTQNLSDAYDYCRKIALGHYENFPVGSITLPKKIRKHIFAVYTFSRIADDIADEDYEISKEERLLLLNKFLENFENVINEKIETTNPIFLALSATISQMNLPLLPFEKLIKAFKMDVDFVRPRNTEDLLNYCRYSANPIGELILRLFGEYDEINAEKSDAITSALQLINFWQDLSVDKLKNRNYIPENITLGELFIYTEKLLNFGIDLPNRIKNRRLKFELKLIVNAGATIFEVIKKMDQRLFAERPSLKNLSYFKIVLQSILWKY